MQKPSLRFFSNPLYAAVLTADADRCLASIADNAPATKRQPITYWCDCAGSNEVHFGIRPKFTDEYEAHVQVPTAVNKLDETCRHCGNYAVARRVTPLANGEASTRARHGNRARARAIVEIDAATKKVTNKFDSIQKALDTGLRSVKYFIKTGRKTKNGKIYAYEDGGKSITYARGKRVS